MQTDRISGMHCWHQAVRVTLHSPDGTRRACWLLRPLEPGREARQLPGPRFGP